MSEDKKNILLVEDDFALAMGTEYALKAENYNVIHAKNLTYARRYAFGCESTTEYRATIDLILLDVMLPDGNGFDFLDELRNAAIYTPAEIRLFRELVRNQGIVLTRSQLMEKLYDTGNSFIDDNTLSVYIKCLRDKLEEDADHIKTIKGVGYRFTTNGSYC